MQTPRICLLISVKCKQSLRRLEFNKSRSSILSEARETLGNWVVKILNVLPCCFGVSDAFSCQPLLSELYKRSSSYPGGRFFFLSQWTELLYLVTEWCLGSLEFGHSWVNQSYLLQPVTQDSKCCLWRLVCGQLCYRPRERLRQDKQHDYNIT